MKRFSSLALLAALPALLLAAPPPLPPTPAPIGSLLLARPFTLDEGFEYSWRAERPLVTSGHLLVLAAEPDLLYPRQTLEPVLYVGDQTAMRLNVGYPSGRVVVLVPSALSAGETSIWFGTPALPEQVDAGTIAEQRALAEAEGIRPLPAMDVTGALELGGEPLRVADLRALLTAADELVDRYVDAGRP